MKVKIECRELDEMLFGGIEGGCITLIYGEAGSGKTNLCLQLARNVGRKKKVIYIDTEGVSVERLKQICGGDYEKIMENILFSESYSFKDQEKIIGKAVVLAENNPEIGIIILDSATTHYRLTRLKEERFDRKSLANQVMKLLSVARKKNLPVVLTSQVYTDLDKGTYEPLGGHMLSHNAKTIIFLEKVGVGKRKATVMKHRHIAEGRSAQFFLTGNGVECGESPP